MFSIVGSDTCVGIISTLLKTLMKDIVRIMGTWATTSRHHTELETRSTPSGVTVRLKADFTL